MPPPPINRDGNRGRGRGSGRGRVSYTPHLFLPIASGLRAHLGHGLRLRREYPVHLPAQQALHAEVEVLVGLRTIS